MPVPPRPHLLGVDDGPFEKGQPAPVPIVGVMMEGADLVETVAVTEFPVDGEDATGFLCDWIASLRCRPALHGVLFGGITIAGLGVLDIEFLAARLGVPVLIVNRRKPSDAPLAGALDAAGLSRRRPILERSPDATPVDAQLHVAQAGTDDATAAGLVRAARAKSDLPEPLRLAHLIARALSTGESRGRP